MGAMPPCHMSPGWSRDLLSLSRDLLSLSRDRNYKNSVKEPWLIMRAIPQHYGVNFSHIGCLKNAKKLDMCIVVMRG